MSQQVIQQIIETNHLGQASLANDRTKLVKRGRRLEYFTIAYNSLEGLIAIAAGLIAGSIALMGFGFDSVIEVTSAAALLWRLQADFDEARRERVKAITLRIVGVCFMALALAEAMTAPSHSRASVGRGRGRSASCLIAQ
jgi:hypothetical protein